MTDSADDTIPTKNQLDPYWFEKGLLSARAQLNAFALRLYRNRSAAEDAVQETICRALETRSTFSPGTCMTAWLRTILRNDFLTHRKCHATRKLDFMGDAAYADHVVAPENPERSIIVTEMLDALESLTPATRDSLVASALGCTLEQIAEDFGITMKVAKSRVFQGRTKFTKLTGGLDAH